MRKRVAVCFILLGFILITVFPQSGTVTTPKTGQSAPGSRFVDNGNGTIADKLTGLMWERAPSTTPMTWAEANLYADNLTLGGYADWRLPYRVEMRSLVQEAQSDYSSWLDSQGFMNIQPADYWSGTWFSYIGTDYGWVVNIRYGGTRSLDQHNSCYVWVVRGEPWRGE
jgi:hypothetical protein